MSSKRIQITFPPLDFLSSRFWATGRILYNVNPFSNTLWVSVKINEARTMSGKEPFAIVWTANYMEAQIVKGRLESAGIPVLLSYESAGLIYGLTVDGLGQVKIMVPKHLAQEAKQILEVDEFAEGKGTRES
jgi:hypothetical protein